ncbi:MAG: LIC11966 family surface protein [Flammeovirgaceae bacterium]
MKKSFIYLIVMLCACSSSFAQKNHPGVDYNDVIVGEHRVLLTLVTDYLVQTVHSDDFKGIEQKRLQVISQVESAIEKIKALGSFEGDTKMRDEALAVLGMYKEAYTQDFNTINSLKAKSQESYQAMAQYLMAEEMAEVKLNNTLKRFNKAQQEFAKRHNLIIDMGEEVHPMDIIFQVYKYNREVFLQYFKVFIQNEACLNALSKHDGDLLEQERLKLLKYAHEAEARLMTMKAYKKEVDYKQSAINYVVFHQASAQKWMAELAQLFKKPTLTQADIHKANDLIDTYNIGLGKAEDDFNHANISLLQTYIPQELD